MQLVRELLLLLLLELLAAASAPVIVAATMQVAVKAGAAVEAAPAGPDDEGSPGRAAPKAAKTVTKEQLLAMMTQEKFKKRFLKQKCAECGGGSVFVHASLPVAAGSALILVHMCDADRTLEQWHA